MAAGTQDIAVARSAISLARVTTRIWQDKAFGIMSDATVQGERAYSHSPCELNIEGSDLNKVSLAERELIESISFNIQRRRVASVYGPPHAMTQPSQRRRAYLAKESKSNKFT